MEAAAQFEQIFGPGEPPRAFFAGGRVNLIGEHTDYNGGLVFPCALTKGTYCLIRRREDSLLRLYTANFPDDGVLSCRLGGIKKQNHSCDYVSGLACMLEKAGYRLPRGYDMLIYGNLPAGAGLSSSASVMMAAGEALNTVYGLGLTHRELALLGKETENAFISVPSGIMDEFAVAMGEKDKALYLDTNTLAYEAVTLELGEYTLLIPDTRKPRTLAGSKYAERLQECRSALAGIRRVLDVPSLCALTPEAFEEAKSAIEGTVEAKRARHAVYENARVKAAKTAMETGDLAGLGRLMHESHVSLRDDYEVSCFELDTLVSAVEGCEGVLGARMTGAGFGGCAVALVKKSALNAVKEAAGKEYEEKTGRKAAFYEAAIGGGPHEVPLNEVIW